MQLTAANDSTRHQLKSYKQALQCVFVAPPTDYAKAVDILSVLINHFESTNGGAREGLISNTNDVGLGDEVHYDWPSDLNTSSFPLVKRQSITSKMDVQDHGENETKNRLIAIIDRFLKSALSNDWTLDYQQLTNDTVNNIMTLNCMDLKVWSSVIHQTLRDRNCDEVLQFVFLMVQILKAQAIPYMSDRIVIEEVVKYLAMKYDESSSNNPLFMGRVALLIAVLGVERGIKVNACFMVNLFILKHIECSMMNLKWKTQQHRNFVENTMEQIQNMGGSAIDLEQLKGLRNVIMRDFRNARVKRKRKVGMSF